MQHTQGNIDKSLEITSPATDEKPVTKVADIICALKRRRDGRGFYDNPWTVIPLSFAEFKNLQDQIDADQSLWGFVDDKVRYDYFHLSQKLVFRMPTSIHESFVRRIEYEIQNQLKAFAVSESPISNFASSIAPGGSTTMHFPEEKTTTDEELQTPFDKHDPDISYMHIESVWPGVVIEISYSQKKKDLPRLADDYIMGSVGNIKMVVGLDIEYRGTQAASLSIWQPQIRVSDEDGQKELFTAQTEVDKVFRLQNGKAVPSVRLHLPLENFAHEGVTDFHTLAGEEVSLSSETLCHFLEGAEAMKKAQRDGLRYSLQPGVRLRPRARTPPEELASEDEAILRTREEYAANEAELDDASYGTGSSSSEGG